MMESEEYKLKPAEKIPTPLPVDNIELIVRDGESIAYGWEPWFATDRNFSKPEFMPQRLTKDGPMVQGIHSEGRYDACLYQRVETVPELAVVFSMRFRITPGNTSSDDDAWPAGLVVGVGVDPTGGVDPRSSDLQWALRDLPYGHEVEASVTATAQQDSATLFVRSMAFIPGSTTAAGNGSGSSCKYSCCRLDYNRTYLLLYPGATEALWKKAAQKAKDYKWTMGASADDAGLGGHLLNSRNIIVVYQNLNAQGVHEPWEANLVQWFHDYYQPSSSLQITWVKDSNLQNYNP